MNGKKAMDPAKLLRRIERLMGASGIGVDIIDAKYNIRYIDPAWQKTLGDPVGRKCYKYFMGRNSVCPGCGIKKALKTKKITITEEILAKEENRPIQVTTIPFKGENGEWLVAETNVDISRIRQAEEKLRESEERYRTVFEKSNDAYLIADPRIMRIVDCNCQAEKLTGYSRRELLSMRADKIVPKNETFKMMRAFRRMSGGEASLEEVGILQKGKGIITASVSGALLTIGGKKFLLGVFRDVTQRKKIDEALRKSEERHRVMFEEGNDAIFVADAKTRALIDCNVKAQKLTGYSLPEILRMRAGQLHPKDMVRETMNGFKEQVLGHTKFVESEILTKDKKRIPVSINASFLDLGGKKCLMGVFRDVTEKRKAEEALRQSEDRYRVLSESAQDAIFIIDRQHRFVYMNSYCALTLGLKRSDAIGRRLKDVFRPDVAAAAVRNNKKVFMSGKSFFITEKLKVPAGERWLDTRLAPIRDARGETIYVVGITRDITLIKKAEEVLRRDRDELDKLASKRSKELLVAHESLNKAKHLAELGLLAATVAHELRTPLAAIRTAAFNINRKSNDPALESHLANIEKKVLESDHIIRNLLAYSRIKVPMYEDVDPCLMLDECIELAREMFRGYKVTIRKMFAFAGGCTIQADPVQLREIFNNILNNAHECFPDRKGAVEVKFWKKGGYFNASFKDNGPGIIIEDLRRITEPFFTTKIRGMGLGLSVCRHIIDLHNGTLDVTSTPGKGTTVKVTLPVRRTGARARQ